MANTNSTKYDVMILYETKHKDMVKRIKDHLEENGFTVWFDENNIGIEVFVSMVDIIKNSRVVLICMSKHYQCSQSSQRELKVVEDYRKRLILLSMDLCEPEGRLETLTEGQLNFEFLENAGPRDFFLAITKLVNAVQAILNEGPDMSESEETINDMSGNALARGGIFPSQEVYENISIENASERQHHDVISDVRLDDSQERIPQDPNTEMHIMVKTMGKPLKDLPGLTRLSQLMDPINTVDRVTQLANCYELTTSDVQRIQDTNTGDNSSAFAFLRFLESSNNDMLISELRECFNTRRDEFIQALGAINLYTDNQTMKDIAWLDTKNLSESGFDWKYVADYFGYSAQIAALKNTRVDANESRFESLCDMISTRFPDHTVSEFVENCQRLHFKDIVQAIESNIKEHAERMMRNRERNNISDRYR